jgi:hypothetical protein
MSLLVAVLGLQLQGTQGLVSVVKKSTLLAIGISKSHEFQVQR